VNFSQWHSGLKNWGSICEVTIFRQTAANFQWMRDDHGKTVLQIVPEFSAKMRDAKVLYF